LGSGSSSIGSLFPLVLFFEVLSDMLVSSEIFGSGVSGPLAVITGSPGRMRMHIVCISCNYLQLSVLPSGPGAEAPVFGVLPVLPTVYKKVGAMMCPHDLPGILLAILDPTCRCRTAG
jgi:hypothetical protein